MGSNKYSFPVDIGTARYDDDVNAVLAQIQRREMPKNPIAFYGSSSFRLWKNIHVDLNSFDIVNLGFGGGSFASGVHYFESLLAPLNPAKIVLYFGENDISNDGLNAASTLDGLRRLHGLIADQLPDATVYLLSTKQSLDKWIYADEVTAFNQLAQQYCQETSSIEYLDMTHCLLGEHGLPIGSLYVSDKIHLSSAGYQRWASILRAHSGLF